VRQAAVENKSVSSAKSICGFFVGIAGSIALMLGIFWLTSDSDLQNPPHALGIVVLMSGIATAKFFQRQNFLAHFDRLSFGMKRRFPVAVYGAWVVLMLGYLLASKYDFGRWYDGHTQKFWLMMIVPPTAILCAIILFRWSNAPVARFADFRTRSQSPIPISEYQGRTDTERRLLIQMCRHHDKPKSLAELTGRLTPHGTASDEECKVIGNTLRELERRGFIEQVAQGALPWETTWRLKPITLRSVDGKAHNCYHLSAEP
jgi:hypothetical protein